MISQKVPSQNDWGTLDDGVCVSLNNPGIDHKVRTVGATNENTHFPLSRDFIFIFIDLNGNDTNLGSKMVSSL